MNEHICEPIIVLVCYYIKSYYQNLMQSEGHIQSKVFKQFSKLGFSKQATLTKEQLLQALQFFCKRNTSMHHFSSKVKNKIWMQCHKDKTGCVGLEQFATVISKEVACLLLLVEKTQVSLGLDQVPLQMKMQLRKKLVLLKSQLKYISQTFKLKLQKIKESNQIQQIELEKPDCVRQEEKHFLEQVREMQGDLFLHIFLKGKGVSEKGIQALRCNGVSSYEQLKEMSLQDICMRGVKLGDSRILKSL